MNQHFKVYWKGNLVGEITNPSHDMWYMNGDWGKFETTESGEFEHQLRNFDKEKFAKDPVNNSIKVILFEKTQPDTKIFCLALSLKENEICLRQVVAEEALNRFFPDR